MIGKRFLMLFSIFSFTNFLGCAQQEKESTITIPELKKVLKEDTTWVVLDVRTPAELQSTLGKIDNVINIPVQELENRITELEEFKDRPIAVICRSGNRSNSATKILRGIGFNAKNVLGGMLEYKKHEN